MQCTAALGKYMGAPDYAVWAGHLVTWSPLRGPPALEPMLNKALAQASPNNYRIGHFSAESARSAVWLEPAGPRPGPVSTPRHT